MGEKGQIIHCLDKKLKSVVITLHRRGIINSPTQSALASALGIAPSSLNIAASANRMSASLQASFARLVGFKITDDRWIDGSVAVTEKGTHEDVSYPYRGRDSIAGFEAMVGECSKQDRARILGFDFVSHDMEIIRIELGDGGQQTQLGLPVQLMMSLTAELAYPNERVSFGFKRLRISLVSNEEHSRFQNRLGSRSYELRNATLENTGGDKQPYWYLTAKDDFLSGEYRTDEEPLTKLHNLSQKGHVEVEVSANVRSTDWLYVQAEKEISKERTAVIEAMLRDAVIGNTQADATGWLTLYRHKLRPQIERYADTI